MSDELDAAKAEIAQEWDRLAAHSTNRRLARFIGHAVIDAMREADKTPADVAREIDMRVNDFWCLIGMWLNGNPVGDIRTLGAILGACGHYLDFTVWAKRDE